MTDTPKPTFWQRRWKLILNVVTILALAGLIFAIRDQVAETFGNLFKVSIWALLLLIPIEIWNYDAQSRLYRSLFAAVGNKLSYKFCYRMALELNFVNHVFPSGGVTGISYFGARARSQHISAARATLIQLMKVVLTILSFELLIVIGTVVLAFNGKANNLTILTAGVLTTLLLVGTLLFVYIIGSKQRIRTFLSAMTKAINRVIQVVRPRHPETINIASAETMFEELHDNYQLFRKDFRQLRAPFWHAFTANVSEVAAVYVVFVAFGEWVNPGAVILAYAVANFAGLISVLPGGVGVYEALMTGVLAVAGVPASISLPVVVMYRILMTLIQVPPGYILYQRSVNRNAFRADNA
jgi:uncharacterized protein (TIRG00374 family)